MIIDWHAHVHPPEENARRANGPPTDIDRLLEAHQQAGIDLCVVSQAT